MSYEENRISDQIDGGLYEKEKMQNRIDELESKIKETIEKLISIERFDLANYRDGEYGIDTEREFNDSGAYIDSYEIDKIIYELKNVYLLDNKY